MSKAAAAPDQLLREQLATFQAEVKALGQATGRPRLCSDRMTAANLVAIRDEVLAWERIAGAVAAQGVPVVDAAARRAADLDAQLGPEAEEPASEATIREAIDLIAAAAKLEDRLLKLPKIWNGAELMAATIPLLRWIVPELIPAGIFLLIGLFKLGKSWLVLGLCIAVATGGVFLGRYRVKRARVLYLALEDGPRRILSRAAKMGERIPASLAIAFEWRRGAEGVADIQAYLANNRDVGLVVVDTLSRFRAPAASDDVWGRDYDEIASLKKIADEFEIALILVHHRSKAARDDIHQTAAGTNALQGAVDGSLLLDRKRGARTGSLSITGRDIPEKEIALDFDSDRGLWTAVDGLPSNARLSPEQVEILNLVNAQDGQEIGPSEIATLTGRAKSTASELLAELAANNQIAKGSKRGKYRGLYTIKSPELPNNTSGNNTLFGSSANSGTYRRPYADGPEGGDE